MPETLTPTQPKKGRYNNRPRRAGKEGPAGPGDQSLRRAALIAGSALLGVTVLAAYAYVVVIGGLVVDGDAARTASNIAEAEGRFRTGSPALPSSPSLMSLSRGGYGCCSPQ